MATRGSQRRSIVTLPRRRFDTVQISEKIDIRTVVQSLRDVDNDYSANSVPFKAGEVKFVDLLGPRAANHRYRQDRQSVFEQLLNDPDAGTLSIVIPVVVGRKRSLFECVASIERQTFFRSHPDKVELIIVQDGLAHNPARNPLSDELTDQLRVFPKYKLFRLNPTSMAESSRRATARNIGVFYGSHTFVFFLDSSMVLEQNFLAEHILRHTRTTGSLALVGFKQNITPIEYRSLRKRICDGIEMPEYQQDWKWRGGYMKRTGYLKSLRGDGMAAPGYPLTRFCHTGLTSIRLNSVKDVGGFHIGFQAYWGFEDTFLGALLLAWGTKIVPCPSSVAFMIQHRESRKRKTTFDSPRNLSQYEQRLSTALSCYNTDSLKRQIDRLWESKTLELVEVRPKPTGARGEGVTLPSRGSLPKTNSRAF